MSEFDIAFAGMTPDEIRSCADELVRALTPRAGGVGFLPVSPGDSPLNLRTDDDTDGEKTRRYDAAAYDAPDFVNRNSEAAELLELLRGMGADDFSDTQYGQRPERFSPYADILRGEKPNGNNGGVLRLLNEDEPYLERSSGGSEKEVADYALENTLFSGRGGADSRKDDDLSSVAAPPGKAYENAVGTRGTEMGRISEFFRRDSRRYDAPLEKY